MDENDERQFYAADPYRETIAVSSVARGTVHSGLDIDPNTIYT